MEGNVEIVELEKYPETPLPREMIDLEVQNLEQDKERGKGMSTGYHAQYSPPQQRRTQ